MHKLMYIKGSEAYRNHVRTPYCVCGWLGNRVVDDYASIAVEGAQDQFVEHLRGLNLDSQGRDIEDNVTL